MEEKITHETEVNRTNKGEENTYLDGLNGGEYRCCQTEDHESDVADLRTSRPCHSLVMQHRRIDITERNAADKVIYISSADFNDKQTAREQTHHANDPMKLTNLSKSLDATYETK